MDATPPGTYRQRGTSSLRRLFRTHFPELTARFDEFAKRLGRFRLERITKAVERFLACGDYRRGVANAFANLENALVSFSFRVPGYAYAGARVLLPYGLIAAFPTEVFFGGSGALPWLQAVPVVVGFTLLTALAWRPGLAGYESTGT